MSDAVSTTGILVKRKALTPPTGIAITSSSAANPSLITTGTPHGLRTGDQAVIIGHTGSTPSINNTYAVTVVSPTTFTIPVTVTVGGTGGTFTPGFVVIGEIREVKPGGKSRNKLDTSTHNEGTESKVLGILRQDDPEVKINFVGTEATHLAVNSDIDNNVKNNWQIAFPSGITRTGDARVAMLKFADAPVDAVQEADFGLTWAGPVTEAFA